MTYEKEIPAFAGMTYEATLSAFSDTPFVRG